MKARFTQQDGNLVIEDVNDGHELWRGKPEGHVVKYVFLLGDIDICAAFLDPQPLHSPIPNLIGIDHQGSVVWRAELPDLVGDDIYVNAEMQSGVLVGFSWSGYRVTIDPLTGKILSRRFTK